MAGSVLKIGVDVRLSHNFTIGTTHDVAITLNNVTTFNMVRTSSTPEALSLTPTGCLAHKNH